MYRAIHRIDAWLSRSVLVDPLLKGAGQILFQASGTSGVLVLLGLFIAHWRAGGAALLSLIIAHASSLLFRFPVAEVRQGLYGFSAALVGIALATMFQDHRALWACIALGSIAACIAHHLFTRIGLVPFTFPFIMVTWVGVLVLDRYIGVPRAVALSDSVEWSANGAMAIALKGFAQVFLQTDTWSGALFLLALLVGSPRAALLATSASGMSALLATALGIPTDVVGAGVFGYNALLTTIAFTGTTRVDGWWSALAAGLAFGLQVALGAAGWFDAFGGLLTLPFVAACWIVRVVRKYAGVMYA